jgi:hypothetical protein|tara:strand:+ start:676 stop:888 length:213 start_codon:yes stop_codon:yes gene_type:complete
LQQRSENAGGTRRGAIETKHWFEKRRVLFGQETRVKDGDCEFVRIRGIFEDESVLLRAARKNNEDGDDVG